MVSSPPVEVLYNDGDDEAYVSFTATGNSHVRKEDGRLFLDEWALHQLSKQAEQAADGLSDE